MSSNILENMYFFISRNVPYTAKMKMHFLRNLPNICKGKNVYCPCCGTKMNHMEKLDDKHYPITAYNRKWRNIANPNDAYAICPVCDSAPRHRILAYYLDSSGVLEHLRDKDIIYFTEERGMRFFLDKRGIRHKCANLNKEADPLREADLYIDIQDMPFADNSVDAIFANHILEHVADYKKAICEVYRVIREGGGMFFCTVPLDPKLHTTYEDDAITTPEAREREFGAPDHKRLFGADFAEILESLGFRVTVVNGNDLPREIVPVYGPSLLDWNELYVCVKSE